MSATHKVTGTKSELPPYPPTQCDLALYKAGGKGAREACDEWPPVEPEKLKCTCPPDKSKYDKRKAAAVAKIIPFLGDAIGVVAGMPEDCSGYIKNATTEYTNAQNELVSILNNLTQATMRIASVFSQIFIPGDASTHYKPTGILPDAIELALAPAKHTNIKLGIILFAMGLILIGVVITV